MLPKDAHITSAFEDNDLDAARNPIRVMRIQYVIGNDGPFVDRVPKSDDWVDKAHAVITARATELARLRQTSPY